MRRLCDGAKAILAKENIRFERDEDDRTDVPTDFRLLGGLLQAAQDPDVSIGSFARGPRVGPGCRMPRCPKPYTKQRKWPIPEQRE